MPAAPQSPHVRRRGRDVGKAKAVGQALNLIRCFGIILFDFAVSFLLTARFMLP